MEAFSDGVLAIVITIMVLEMKVPHGDDWSALTPMTPVFGSYVMSFVYIGIYWNNTVPSDGDVEVIGCIHDDIPIGDETDALNTPDLDA